MHIVKRYLEDNFANSAPSTSPSIYANFHALTAADECGNVGSRGIIAQTLLAFAPGELSTIAGPLYDPVGTLYTKYSTRAFDFADFPCPPQSVMVSCAQSSSTCVEANSRDG